MRKSLSVFAGLLVASPRTSGNASCKLALSFNKPSQGSIVLLSDFCIPSLDTQLDINIYLCLYKTLNCYLPYRLYPIVPHPDTSIGIL
jgi:hypothetical protein